MPTLTLTLSKPAFDLESSQPTIVLIKNLTELILSTESDEAVVLRFCEVGSWLDERRVF